MTPCPEHTELFAALLRKSPLRVCTQYLMGIKSPIQMIRNTHLDNSQFFGLNDLLSCTHSLKGKSYSFTLDNGVFA